MPNKITRQYQRHINNPVGLLWWSTFTKKVNGSKVMESWKFNWVLNTTWVLKCFYIDLVNRISFERKVKKNVGTSKFEYSEDPLGNVLRTSWRFPESISQGRPLNVRLRRPLYVISGRPQDVRLGRPRDVTSIRPRDITSMCPW